VVAWSLAANPPLTNSIVPYFTNAFNYSFLSLPTALSSMNFYKNAPSANTNVLLESFDNASITDKYIGFACS
jgi:hypothetical protein